MRETPLREDWKAALTLRFQRGLARELHQRQLITQGEFMRLMELLGEPESQSLF